ncbi:hypothetical protein VTN02DRAFT_4112 [Thermoascus thermophilus]
MLDPFAPPPQWLRAYTEPWAEYLNLPTLSEHVHEILAAFLFYQFVHSYLSSWLSTVLFPRFYPHFPPRTKLNWDVHVVSLVQSTLINLAALWVMFVDRERQSMSPAERVYGYTGASGLVQALATGYFVYDLIVSTRYVKLFGVGMLFHAVSALWVFSLGFRPFLNYYAPTFILYELSSPFLNIHWFLDKVNMTGSKVQWYNGMMLLFVFFSCRLVWGTWQSACVYMDMWKALKQTWSMSAASALVEPPVGSVINPMVFEQRNVTQCGIDESCIIANIEVAKFSQYTAGGAPLWLAVTYVASNLILNSLNYYWFFKMIEAVMKRFRETAAPSKEKRPEEVKEEIKHEAVLDAAAKLAKEEVSFTGGELDDEKTTSAVNVGANKDLRKRRA